MIYKKHPFIFILAILSIFLNSACKEKCTTTSNHLIYTLLDVTDSASFNFIKRTYTGDCEKIVNTINFEACNAASFSIKRISNLSDEKAQNIKLQPLEVGLTETLYKDAKKNFKNSIKNRFQALVKDGQNMGGREQSQIYAAVCNALKSLKSQKAMSKHLIIYSDMIENSEFGNFYNLSFNNSMSQDSVVVLPILRNLEQGYGKKLPSQISDIHIHIITHRYDKSDKYIRQTERFWRFVFEDYLQAQSFHFSENLVL